VLNKCFYFVYHGNIIILRKLNKLYEERRNKMSNYQFVNVRFNLDKDEEKTLFNKLNPKNRAGNIKIILKQFFLLNDENLMKKVELKEIIREIMDNEMDIRKEKKIQPSVNKNKKITIIKGDE
jgi:hypothetical protein